MLGWPLAYGHVGSKCRVSPLIHREIFDAMLRLPFEYRRSQRFAVDVIKRRWPSLLRIPFNKYTARMALAEDFKARTNVFRSATRT